MSLLNPGGTRSWSGRRIFDHGGISRMCKPQIDRCHKAGFNSIAEGNRHGGAHLHQREIARNQRRAQRRAA